MFFCTSDGGKRGARISAGDEKRVLEKHEFRGRHREPSTKGGKGDTGLIEERSLIFFRNSFVSVRI